MGYGMRHAMTVLSLAALSACGGGGGGGSDRDDGDSTALPGAAADVSGDATRSNYADLADRVYTAFVAGELASLVGGDPTDGSASSKAGAAKVQAVALWSRQHLAKRQGVETGQAQRTFTNSFDCSAGGEVTVRVDDDDNDGAFGQGEEAEIKFRDCVDGGVRYDGITHYEFRSATSTEERYRFDFEDMTVDDYRLDGEVDYTFTETADEWAVRARYDDLLVTSGSTTLRYGFDSLWRYDPDTLDGTLTWNGPIAINGESYWLRQDEAFAFASSAWLPEAGQLSVLDAEGDRVVLVGGPDGLTYQYFLEGQTSPEAEQDGPQQSDFTSAQ